MISMAIRSNGHPTRYCWKGALWCFRGVSLLHTGHIVYIGFQCSIVSKARRKQAAPSQPSFLHPNVHLFDGRACGWRPPSVSSLELWAANGATLACFLQNSWTIDSQEFRVYPIDSTVPCSLHIWLIHLPTWALVSFPPYIEEMVLLLHLPTGYALSSPLPIPVTSLGSVKDHLVWEPFAALWSLEHVG